MIRRLGSSQFVALVVALLLGGGFSADAKTPQTPSKGSAATKAKPPAKKRSRHVSVVVDPTKDDVAEFDDAVVREIAVEALGRRNGSVVAVDPNTGRILSVVNQKLAFAAGFQPCSTIKPVIALAALEEGVITRDTMVKIASRRYMNLTEAMAHSNNPFFETLGRQMGFDTVSRYARLLGLGELAGHNLAEEHPGTFPTTPPPNGGVGRMSSFGEGIQITPLQLASFVATFANGGTMYYLQYPRSEEERRNFAPRVKRKLNIATLLPELREGMLAAVLYGTARSSFDAEGEQILGKTGTCSENGARLGWFVSYADQVRPRIVIAVLLRGGRRTNGPTAADIAGRIYHGLRERNFFAENRREPQNAAGSTP